MQKHLLLGASLVLVLTSALAQPTVGLVYHDSLAQEGYTLFAPFNSKQTYLINTCGEKVNEWSSNYRPGASAYLTPDGLLARAANLQNPSFNIGGTGGAIEFFDWNGNLVRTLNLSTDSTCQHHDFEIMPNGNVLVLAWELVSYEDVVASGRAPQMTDTNGMLPDMILEFGLLPNDEEVVVWEWHSWDHVIQELDTALPNHGPINAHPELINLNVYNPVVSLRDWMHCNSIAYNADLDQIMISTLCYNEIWVIDHSTTTEEAAGHSGGNHSRGGDLIYRYGNPAMYGRGSVLDQKFFGQHNAHWIPNDYEFGGAMIVFNNQAHTNPLRSRVEIFEPPMNAQGQYDYPGFEAFGPDTFSWSYMDENFYALNVSGASMMANGNVLICEGPTGHFLEVDQSGTIHWEYVNPVNSAPVSQGDTIIGYLVFRAERYLESFEGFAGYDMESTGYVEANPIEYECHFRTVIDTTDTTTSIVDIGTVDIRVVNPFSQTIRLSNTMEVMALTVYNQFGQMMWTGRAQSGETSIDTEAWPAGTYLLVVQSGAAAQRSVSLVKVE